MHGNQSKRVVFTQDETDAIQAITFMLDEEANNVEMYIPDAPASDVSKWAADGSPTIATMLRAIAEWLRMVINRSMR